MSALRVPSDRPSDHIAGPLLDEARGLCCAGDFDGALRVLARIKAQQTPIPGVDALRSQCFEALGDASSAEQARREEARWFGASTGVVAARRELLEHTDDETWLARAIASVRPWTMLSERRLASLHALALRTARESIAGDYVECGVAAGGSSALLAGCATRHTPAAPPRVWCFDTFSGMPAPGPEDTALGGVNANDSGWGAGTCSAPEECVVHAAALFGAADRLWVRKGLFQDTLPRAAAEIGAIALLHLDGDWYDSTRCCLEHLWHRMTPGGFVQIDDYGHWNGCRRAVDEFVQAHGITVAIERIDYTGVWLRVPECRR